MPRRSSLPTDPDAPGPARPLHLSPAMLAAVAVGAALGTPARYGISTVWPTSTGHWPTGTFAVNMIGAFLLGLILESLIRLGPDSGSRRLFRLFAGTGFCGAFTTYSTLAVETDLLVRSHDVGLAAGYGLASVAGGLILSGVGVAVARALADGRRGSTPDAGQPDRGSAR